MNYPLDHAIMVTCRSIPPQILELGVKTANKKFHESNNVVEWICNHIINAIVLKDVNLVAGQIKTIVLRPQWLEHLPSDHDGYVGDDGPNTVYRIPPEARDYKPISQVLTCQFPYTTYQSSGIANADVASGGFSLVDQVEQVINSYNLATPRNHPLVTLMSGDLIRLTPSQYTRQFWLLTCRINYDETFNNLHDASIPILSNMVMLATKQWLWNNLVVDIDKAAMMTGVEIGTIRSIIEEYKDAGQLYEEERTKFRGSTLLDTETRRRILTYQL